MFKLFSTLMHFLCFPFSRPHLIVSTLVFCSVYLLYYTIMVLFSAAYMILVIVLFRVSMSYVVLHSRAHVIQFLCRLVFSSVFPFRFSFFKFIFIVPVIVLWALPAPNPFSAVMSVLFRLLPVINKSICLGPFIRSNPGELSKNSGSFIGYKKSAPYRIS